MAAAADGRAALLTKQVEALQVDLAVVRADLDARGRELGNTAGRIEEMVSTLAVERAAHAALELRLQIADTAAIVNSPGALAVDQDAPILRGLAGNAASRRKPVGKARGTMLQTPAQEPGLVDEADAIIEHTADEVAARIMEMH